MSGARSRAAFGGLSDQQANAVALASTGPLVCTGGGTWHAACQLGVRGVALCRRAHSATVYSLARMDPAKFVVSNSTRTRREWSAGATANLVDASSARFGFALVARERACPACRGVIELVEWDDDWQFGCRGCDAMWEARPFVKEFWIPIEEEKDD